MVESLNDVVQVTATIEGADASAPGGFGSTLFVTTDDALDVSGSDKVKSYGSLAAVSEDFNTGDEPYQAALVYFQRTPYPRQLVVARLANVGIRARLDGGSSPTLVALQAITSPVISFGVIDVTVSFVGDTSLSEAAESIESALQASSIVGAADIMVEYNATESRFELTFGFDSAGAPRAISFPTGNVATALGFVSGTGTITAGTAAESVDDFFAAVLSETTDWYWVTIESDLADTSTAENIGDWVGSNARQLILDSHASGVLTEDASEPVVTMAGEDPQRVFVIHSETEDYKAVSVAAFFAGTDFDGAETVGSIAHKDLPGTTPDTYDDDEIAALNDLGVNRYTTIGSLPGLRKGVNLKPGTYPDEIYWLDWFTYTVQVDVYALLRSTRRIARTDAGVAQVLDTVTSVCQTGVGNGGIAPGPVSAAVAQDIRDQTGNNGFNGELDVGYLIHVDPFTSLTATQNANRELPPIRVWLKGADSVHFVDIDISFS